MCLLAVGSHRIWRDFLDDDEEVTLYGYDLSADSTFVGRELARLVVTMVSGYGCGHSAYQCFRDGEDCVVFMFFAISYIFSQSP